MGSMPVSARRRRRIRLSALVIVGVLVGSLALATSAGAEIFTGAVTDKPNDMSLDNGDTLTDPRVDYTKASVKFDDETGRVDASFTFTSAPLASQRLQAGISLGTRDSNGTCDAPFFISLGWHIEGSQDGGHGQAAIIGHWGQITGPSGSGVEGRVYNQPYSSWFDQNSPLDNWTSTGPTKTWNFGTVNTALVGRYYNCAEVGMMAFDENGHGVDWLDAETFAVTSSVPPPPPPPPVSVVKWISPKRGQTVSGVYSEGTSSGRHYCDITASGTIVQLENYVDGRLNDTQVNAPWSCEWDTTKFTDGEHSLSSVGYDAQGHLLAKNTITVFVDNPSPPPVNTPPPPVVEAPIVAAPTNTTTTIYVLPSPSPSGPAPSRVFPTLVTPAKIAKLTNSKAKTLAKRALRRRYGARTYTLICSTFASGLRSDCRATWKRKGKKLRRTVTIIRDEGGDTVRLRA